MYQKIKAKFKANPTIFYACSIVASWAGVGSLMNFRTLAINNGAAAAIIWAVFNSLACILFGLFAEYIPTVRRLMQSKVMFYFIGFLTVFQTWTQMSGIYEIFGDTPIGTTGGTLIVYGTCIVPIEAPMEKIWFTFEYDPAVVEALLHPPDSGQEQPFSAEKVL